MMVGKFRINNQPFLLQLSLRVTLILAVNSIYTMSGQMYQFLVFIPFIIFDLKSFWFSHSTLSILRAINILIVYSPLFAISLVYFFSFSPIGIVGNRVAYFIEINIEKAFIVILEQGVVFGTFAYYKLQARTMTENKSKWKNGYLMLWFCVHIISAFLSNQGGNIVEGGYGGDSFQVEGAWGGWALVFVLTSSIGFVQYFKQKNKIVLYILLGSVFIFLISGNRGEVLIHCFIFCYIFVQRRNAFFVGSERFQVKQILPAIALASIVFVSFEFIGNLRVTGISNADNRGEMSLMVGTLGSYTYSVISMIGIADDIGVKYGETFTAYLINSVPSFIPVPWERVQDISNLTAKATTRGGSGFAGEAYLNFGIFGPSLIALIYLLFMISVYRKATTSNFYFCFYVALTLYLPRFVYYGYVYPYKLLILFVFIGLFLKLLPKKKSH